MRPENLHLPLHPQVPKPTFRTIFQGRKCNKERENSQKIHCCLGSWAEKTICAEATLTENTCLPLLMVADELSDEHSPLKFPLMLTVLFPYLFGPMYTALIFCCISSPTFAEKNARTY